MNYLRFIAFSFILFFGLPSLANAESECARRVNLESSEVTITPESDCLEIEVLESDCADAVIMRFKNTCDEKITLKRTNSVAEFQEEIEPMKSVDDWSNNLQENDQTFSYIATMGEETLDIEVSFTATFEIPDYSTCSSVGTGNFSFLLLGFGLVFVRRRSRK